MYLIAIRRYTGSAGSYRIDRYVCLSCLLLQPGDCHTGVRTGSQGQGGMYAVRRSSDLHVQNISALPFCLLRIAPNDLLSQKERKLRAYSTAGSPPCSGFPPDSLVQRTIMRVRLFLFGSRICHKISRIYWHRRFAAVITA